MLSGKKMKFWLIVVDFCWFCRRTEFGLLLLFFGRSLQIWAAKFGQVQGRDFGLVHQLKIKNFLQIWTVSGQMRTENDPSLFS